jgi:hydroxymethylpyrimidine pyrophosphatase-like HAD family hydrolase
MAGNHKISLVLADVDGTLVTEEKILTERARDAVNALQHAGILFAITSGRPPLGMAMLFDVLDIETPIAGFNGGLFVDRHLTILEQKTVPPDVARQAIDLMRARGLDTWVYSGNDWLITKAVAPHVAREAWTVKFPPKVVPDIREHLQQVAKIVAVSDDLDKVRRCEAEAQAAFGQRDRHPLSTLLPRRHQQGCQQGCRGGISRAARRRASGGDCDHRRSTKRRADVQALRV